VKNTPIRRSLVLLLANLLKLVTVDVLFNFRNTIVVIILGGLLLLFGFFIWIVINSALIEYLIYQGINYAIIYMIVLLLNIIALMLCGYFFQRQLNKLHFYYTTLALEKVKTNFGKHNEKS